LRIVDTQRATAELLAVGFGDCLVRLGVLHLDNAKPRDRLGTEVRREPERLPRTYGARLDVGYAFVRTGLLDGVDDQREQVRNFADVGLVKLPRSKLAIPHNPQARSAKRSQAAAEARRAKMLGE
jgi:hypothetical protein